MPIICRLIALSDKDAISLAASPTLLVAAVNSAEIYSDVYRYWHAIDYLLAQLEGDVVSSLLSMGTEVSAADADVPGARVLDAAQVSELQKRLEKIEPDALAPYYDAAELDAAGIYPEEWVAWEEDFDPLGQVLEHFSYLQFFVSNRAESSDGMNLYFELSED